MDCNMPVMDGFEPTVKIREMFEENGGDCNNLNSSQLPYIVALTANSSDSIKE